MCRVTITVMLVGASFGRSFKEWLDFELVNFIDISTCLNLKGM